KEENSKEISMEVKTIESCGIYSLIEIKLITGRSHQIRAHLNKLGNNIVGDTKYGDKKVNDFFMKKYGLKYQYLYAYKYVLKDPRNELSYLKNKIITAGLPPIFKKIKADVFKF
ncbi:MAG: RluA family pseudouridine synthase, partial [Oscillospiraceae bacterium]|nr:RluA family pseudouridine synthase [Oscillospiraceae bacterium]